MLRALVATILTLLLPCASGAQETEVSAAVIRVDYPTIAPISRFELMPDDLGFAGAVLADEDNGTTGSFLGQTYTTETLAVTPDALDGALDRLLADGVGLFVVLADDIDLLRAADRVAEEGGVVFNAQTPDDRLRGSDCRANMLHVAPSRRMLADATVQFVGWKQWDELFLVHGSNSDDLELADAYRRAVAKFQLDLRGEREFEDTGGSRRSDSGHVLVQRQLPVFMQDTPRHDVVLAADESDVFAPYLPFHLWTPRPVLGSGGLRPVTFHAAHEAWGATQFQRRFEELTGRYVREEDYQVWLALRAVGEAVTRTGGADPQALRDYVLSPDFALAAFKGQSVTFRDWNGQLRQPILLYDGRITVSVSPQDGYLHQISPLDTLGVDRPETECTAFEEPQ